MQKDKIIKNKIVAIEGKIERATNCSSGSIEAESRIDDLCYELLSLENEYADIVTSKV